MNPTPAIVALSQLAFDMAHNSRQGLDEKAMAELVKSIEQNGLIVPLTVRPSETEGLYLVMDGHRRLEALNRLYGDQKESFHVPVLVRDADDKDACALSLAANIVRLPLHPADQYQAFAGMLDEGMERQEIASRFNLAVKDVERILALGRVIPAVLQQYREGKLDADTVKLFAACSEERQLAVWRKAVEDRSTTRWQIKQLLESKALNQHSPILRLVEEADYEAAGGQVERSLFDDGDVRWLDVEIAMKLARQAIAEKVALIREEGWAFVSHEEDMPPNWKNWSRVYPEAVFTPEQEADLAATDKRLDELHGIDADDWTDENEEEQEKLEERQGEIRDQAETAFSPEQRAAAGVVICEDFTIVAGVRKPEKVAQPEEAEQAEKEEPWPQSLRDDLCAAATDAIQVAVSKGGLGDQLAFFCAAIICSGYSVPSSISARTGFTYGNRDKPTQVAQAIEAQLASMGLDESHDFWEMYTVIAAAPDATDIEVLFGLCLASTVQTVRREDDVLDFKSAFPDTDIEAVFKPDEMFFNRLKLPHINACLTEMGQRPMKEGLKKKESVEYAANWAKKLHWLPKFLRSLVPPLNEEQKARLAEYAGQQTAAKKAKAKPKMRKAA